VYHQLRAFPSGLTTFLAARTKPKLIYRSFAFDTLPTTIMGDHHGEDKDK